MGKFKIVCEDCNKVCEAIYLNGIVKCAECGKTLNENEYMSCVQEEAIVVRENPIIIMDEHTQKAFVKCLDSLSIIDILEMLGREATEDTALTAVKLKQIMNYMVLGVASVEISGKPLNLNIKIREA